MRFQYRKIYFIKKDFQTRFILRFVAVATVWAMATIMLFAYLAGKRLERLRFSSHFDITTTSEMLLPITIGVHVISLLVFACVLAYAIHSLWKRLSPPLAIIKKDIARIADGELTNEIILKENDEFQDLAADLNEMRTGLREKLDRMKELHGVLSDATVELSGSIAKGSPPLAHAASLQSAVERMKEGLQAFHY